MKQHIILLPIILIYQLCHGQNFVKFPIKDLQRDYTALRKHIETKNPITYLYQPKEKITAYLDSIGLHINRPMTTLEFYRLISPVSSLIYDGHNLMMPSDEVIVYLDQHPHNIPLQIAHVGKDLYIVENYSENNGLKPKHKITSINNIATDSILQRLYLVLPREGLQTQLTAHYIHKWFRFFYHLHFGFSENYKVQYTDRKGAIKEIVIRGLSMDEIIKKRKENTPVRPTDKGISIDIIDRTAKIALLNVPSFSPLILKERYHQKKFKKEIDTCFDLVFKHRIKHLIIDIRDNGGGNPVYSVYLLKYLFNGPFTQASGGRVVKHPDEADVLKRTKNKWLPWYGIGEFKPKKKSYPGKIYVLTSGATFSAAVEFAATLKKYNRALFFGEETGGSPFIMTGNYVKEYRQLPRTKIAHYSGNIGTIYNDLKLNNGRGIIPDYPVTPRIDDLISTKDVGLEKVMSIIGKKQ